MQQPDDEPIGPADRATDSDADPEQFRGDPVDDEDDALVDAVLAEDEQDPPPADDPDPADDGQ